MPKKLSEKEKKKREELIAEVKKRHNEGILIKEIAKELDISLTQAFAHSKGYDSAVEYQKDLLKRKYGLPLSAYRRLKELEKGYRQEVSRLLENLNRVGYGITKLKEEKGTLAIKLSEKDGKFDEEDIKRDFEEHLREYSQAIGAKSAEEFKVFYRKKAVFIKVKNINDLESRARLSTYGFSLRREVVRQI